MPDRLLLTGDPRRLQEVAPAEYADEVYVRSAWDAAISLGRAYLLDTGRVTLALAGNVRCTVTNPAGSGKVATVLGVGGMVTATGWASVIYDPTTGLPATAARPAMRLNRSTGDAPSTQLKVDTHAATPLGGGTDTGVVVGFAANTPRTLSPLGVVLAPGQALGVNALFAGSADAAIGFYVVEESL